MKHGKAICILVSGSALVILAACGHSASESQDALKYRNSEYGVSVSYPYIVQSWQEFRSNFFLDDRWNPDAPQGVQGKGLLTLQLPNSNKLMTGKLRLGASADVNTSNHCTLPSGGNTSRTSTVKMDGVKFKKREIRDAAMNHFMIRRAYRGVKNQYCYAMDLVVQGTNPGVYPGHPKPPMSREQTMSQLQALLQGIKFH